LNGAEITVADDGTFVVSGSFAQEWSLTLSFAVVADDVTCNETQELVLTYDEPNGGVCEDIRDIQILEWTTSVTNSVTTYEFNGSYLDTNLATFLITQNWVQIDASNIALSKVWTSSRTNFRTVASLNEWRNVFVFTATSEQSEEICNDSETVVITRNTRTTGGSSGWWGRASSILCGNRRIDDSRGVREQCDDGNTRSGDGCSSTCQIEEEPVCGNGIIELGEMCDDSNRTNWDWCSATCDIEDEEIKREIVREQIKETIRKRRPVPLSYTPPRVLPKTGNKVRSWTDFRKMIR
jgi:cysteine-rich repeat protein